MSKLKYMDMTMMHVCEMLVRNVQNNLENMIISMLDNFEFCLIDRGY